MAKDSPVITLGGKELSTPQAKIKRFSCLIWGSSGGGSVCCRGGECILHLVEA